MLNTIIGHQIVGNFLFLVCVEKQILLLRRLQILLKIFRPSPRNQAGLPPVCVSSEMAACGSFCTFRLKEVGRAILFYVTIVLNNIFQPAGVRPKPKAKPSHRPIFYTDAPPPKNSAEPLYTPPGLPINDISVPSGAFGSEFRICAPAAPPPRGTPTWRELVY